MVVFTCNHCGESVKKPRVSKHYQFNCNGVISLTCVDCFKDFGDNYVVHTSCVTEEERYAAKGTYPEGIVKKGEVKQGSWVQTIKIVNQNLADIKPSHRNLLNNISIYNNVPRKKHKFINFIKNSCRRASEQDIEAVWDLIEKHATQTKSCTGENDKTNSLDDNRNLSNKEARKRKNADSDHENERINKESESDHKRRKLVKNEAAVENQTTANLKEIVDEKDKVKSIKHDQKPCMNENTLVNEDTEKFSFQDSILALLRTKRKISTKKLQKKILRAYIEYSGDEISDKIIKKFNKKLNKIPNIKIEKNYVQLEVF